MKILPKDNRFIKEVYKDGEYGFLDKYSIVIDIGANIGTFSIWIYGRAEKIYAIEPVEQNVTYLTENIRINRLEKITVVQLAITGRNGVFRMEEHGDPTNGGWKVSNGGSYPVTGMMLKDFMEWKNIEYADLVKIDTEGMEYDILSSELFPKDKIGTIIGEFHLDDKGEKLGKILVWMGYRFNIFGNKFIARK